MKTKYTSKTAAKPSWKNAILLAITALALLASAGIALADCLPVTNWTDGSGSWFTSGNWDGGVPDSGKGAVINNGGKAQISASLPAANACSLSLGPTAGHSGNVSVSTSGSLTVTYGIVVGNQGTGSLTVTSQGSVTSQLGEVDVGQNSSTISATGLLTVTDSGSVTATSVAVNGSGTLTGNGTVNSDATVGGTLSPNWTLTINGSLTFASGGTMQCNVTPANLGSIDAEVTGTATLTGRLSVTMTGTFTCGTQYTLLYTHGGRVNDSKFSSVSINFPTGQNFTPQIIYDTYHVYLYLACNTD